MNEYTFAILIDQWVTSLSVNLTQPNLRGHGRVSATDRISLDFKITLKKLYNC